MGYTHYWEIKKGTPKLSKACLDDIKKVCERYGKLIQFEEDEKKPIVLKPGEIRFNGIGENGHETFLIECPPKPASYQAFKDGFLFNFCKTARKPYDIVVCEILLILKAHLQENIKLSSDGFSNYECSFDGEWNKAIEEVKGMGYKIDCCVYSRDKGENPYYDCEIKNIKIN